MNREPRDVVAAGGRRITPSKAFVEFAKSETEQSIATRFERQVEIHGDRLAIKTEQGEINYRDLNRAANRITHAILAYRGDCEEPVALLLERGAPTVAAILGALKAGKIYVPLDPWFPLARNADIVKDAAPKLIIADYQHFALASSLAGDGAAIINIDALDTSTANPGLNLVPDRLAYILYTSGSTGQPKGVVQNHRNVLNVVMRYTNAVGLNAQDRLTLLPSSSVTASVGNTFGALLNGASLFPFDVKANVSAVLVEHLRKHDITVYQSVPAVFRHLASALNGKDLFPNLRVIRLGSASVLKSDFDLFKEHFSADCVFINGYGASEMSTVSQYCMDRNSKIGGATVPVGYPLGDTRIILLDEDGKPVETGGIGEIVLQSRYLALGYWRKPELTSKVFFDDPSCAGARLYLTGDVGRMLLDGCLEHLGRKDFQVKVRGYRIETAEIEFALLQQAQVKEAAVVACDDECGDKRLVAYIVPAENPPVPALAKGGGGGISQVLRAHLKAKLPDYMLPSSFVALDQMPLTPNGKLDRKALPAPDRLLSDSAPVAPRTPLEQQLAAIFASVLKIDRVGIRDNFFDLGGHSFLVLRVLAEIEKNCGRRLSVATLFQAPTVEEIGQILTVEDSFDDSDVIVPLNPHGTTPPLFSVWMGIATELRELCRYLGPEQRLYGINSHWDPKQMRMTRLEEMAAYYLTHLRKIQPHGPYYLSSDCLATLIVLEMAQQLLAQGEQVAALLLIDPPPPRTWMKNPAAIRYRNRYSSRIKRHLRKVVNRNVIEQLAYLSVRALNALWGRIALRICMVCRLPLSRPLLSRYVYDVHQRAKNNYVPRPYAGKIWFIWAADDMDEARRSEIQNAWSRLAAQATHHTVPGVHVELFKEPYVSPLAEQMKICLAEARTVQHPGVQGDAAETWHGAVTLALAQLVNIGHDILSGAKHLLFLC